MAASLNETPRNPRPIALRLASRAAAAALAVAALVSVGVYWWLAGRWQWSSDETLLTWTETHPTDSAAQIALGHRLRQRGQDAPAAFAFARAIESRPSDIETRRELARTLLVIRQDDAALLQMREIALRDPTDAFSQQHLGEYYLSHGAPSWAIEAFEHVTAAQPGNAAAWSQLGETYLSLHQTGRANKAFEKAVKLVPGCAAYRVGLARASLEAGRVDQAEPLLRGEVDGAAGAQAAYFLGILYMRSPGEPAARQQARYWLESACRKDPRAAGPLLALGKLMLGNHQAQQAINSLERAASITASDPEPHYYLARAYREIGDYKEAQACLAHFDDLRRSQEERQSQFRPDPSPATRTLPAETSRSFAEDARQP